MQYRLPVGRKSADPAASLAGQGWVANFDKGGSPGL